MGWSWNSIQKHFREDEEPSEASEIAESIIAEIKSQTHVLLSYNSTQKLDSIFDYVVNFYGINIFMVIINLDKGTIETRRADSTIRYTVYKQQITSKETLLSVSLYDVGCIESICNFIDEDWMPIALIEMKRKLDYLQSKIDNNDKKTWVSDDSGPIWTTKPNSQPHDQDNKSWTTSLSNNSL